MATKSIGDEFEEKPGPDGKTILVRNPRKVKAKLNLCARLSYEKRKSTRVRYGKKGAI